MTPVKPFDTYKWRWLSTMPTENLLDPPVLLGVLRVLARYQGVAPSEPEIADALRVVQNETNTTVNLVRTPERNLIRNSGQYWKGTGLLQPDRGAIQLTSLGARVAEGAITQAEFAALMVQQTVLPNPWTYQPNEISKWNAAGLRIKPLALILEIIEDLKAYGSGAAYLQTEELIKIVIPLAGAKVQRADIVSFLLRHRNNDLDISDWPNCAPKANDERLAREFLLFLSNFGLCQKVDGRNKSDEKYYSDELFSASTLEDITTASIFGGDVQAEEAIRAIRHSALPSIIERQKTRIVTRSSRSSQSGFRKNILSASNGICLITGERIPEVLEAAHIIPVANNGQDSVDNGICLRVDIHRLFDSGNIRMKSNGDLRFSDAIRESHNYNSLPRRVDVPAFVNPVNIEWRDKYC